jgi:hypothetical protein
MTESDFRRLDYLDFNHECTRMRTNGIRFKFEKICVHSWFPLSTAAHVSTPCSPVCPSFALKSDGRHANGVTCQRCQTSWKCDFRRLGYLDFNHECTRMRTNGIGFKFEKICVHSWFPLSTAAHVSTPCSPVWPSFALKSDGRHANGVACQRCQTSWK